MNKIPFMLIIGENEEKDGAVSVRKHSEGDLGTFSINAFSNLIQEEIDKTLQQF